MKTAMITGITGQDGSYLSELLLEKDYKVIACHRRSSTNNLQRVRHLLHNPNFKLEEFDLTDPSGCYQTIKQHQPDEFYNLAAQSHVGTSFKQPSATFEINTIGVTNILEAIRNYSPHTRLYQASTSEMFGRNYSTKKGGRKYQDERTQMLPQSPYGVAKLAAHNMIEIYRSGYDMFACCGILFNHETVTYGTPLIIKINDKIDILPIGDVARFHTGVVFNLNNKNYQEGKPTTDIKVWDQNGWVDIKWVSGYPHKLDKNPRIINARNYVYAATGNHLCIMHDDQEIATSDLKLGDKVKNINYPATENIQDISLEKAEWLGMLVADGCISNNKIRLTNKDFKLKKRFSDLWNSFNPDGHTTYSNSKSGFNNENVGQVNCFGSNEKFDIYTHDLSAFNHKNKKVPIEILNASINVMEAFLVGYNICDGLKKNPCKYKFKNFKTNSPTLAAGLLYLVSKVTQQKYNITVEESWKWGKQQFYYSINLLSDKKTNIEKYEVVKKLLDESLSQRSIHTKTGISRSFIRKVQNGYIPTNNHHLELCSNEIKKIIDIPNYSGWFFDLETSSGTFHAGVGQGVIHNSPRRGENFVTRKITKYIGQVIRGETKEKLKLGNLDAHRDWGHAKDYVRAMHLMLQHNRPVDLVIATGKTYSVKDFLRLSFESVNLDYYQYVDIDPDLFRPAEVDYLCGDSTLASQTIGWTPSIDINGLVKDMVESDINNVSQF